MRMNNFFVGIFRNKFGVLILSSTVFLHIYSGDTFGLINREYTGLMYNMKR